MSDFSHPSAQGNAEQARQTAEARFRALVQHSSDLITVSTPDGTLRYVSPAVEPLLGYTPEELVGTSSLALLHPDDVARVMEEVGAQVNGKAPQVAVEYRLRRKDASWIHMEGITTNLLEDPAVAGVVTNSRDVTERFEAAAAFRALVEHSSDIITVLEPDGSWRSSSGAGTRLLGYPPGHDPEGGVFSLIHPDDQHLALIAFGDLIEGRRGPDEPIVLRARSADGTWHFLETVGRNLVHDPLVRGIVLNSRDVTDRIRLKEQLEHQATHDPLTDLPNRALLQTLAEQAFARAQRAGSIVAALYVDLDAFKAVNDTLGHAAGDAVLVRVATRLRDTLRVGDLVARVGGDEFVVLLESLTDDEEALQIARRVIDGVSQPLWLDSRLIEVGASVGTAIDHGERETVEQLIRDADVALYRAKANGRSRVELFWPPPIPSTAPKPASRARPPADTG